MVHTNQINLGNRVLLYSLNTIPKKKNVIYGSGKYVKASKTI